MIGCYKFDDIRADTNTQLKQIIILILITSSPLILMVRHQSLKVLQLQTKLEGLINNLLNYVHCCFFEGKL